MQNKLKLLINVLLDINVTINFRPSIGLMLTIAVVI